MRFKARAKGANKGDMPRRRKDSQESDSSQEDKEMWEDEGANNKNSKGALQNNYMSNKNTAIKQYLEDGSIEKHARKKNNALRLNKRTKEIQNQKQPTTTKSENALASKQISKADSKNKKTISIKPSSSLDPQSKSPDTSTKLKQGETGLIGSVAFNMIDAAKIEREMERELDSGGEVFSSDKESSLDEKAMEDQLERLEEHLGIKISNHHKQQLRNEVAGTRKSKIVTNSKKRRKEESKGAFELEDYGGEEDSDEFDAEVFSDRQQNNKNNPNTKPANKHKTTR